MPNLNHRSFPFRIKFSYERLKEPSIFRGWYYGGWNNGLPTVRDPACAVYNSMEISYVTKKHLFTLTFIETELWGVDKRG